MKMSKIRLLIAIVISIMPLSSIRVWAYRNFLRYKIGHCVHIGLFTVISVDNFECHENVNIGRNTYLIGPMSVSIGARTIIGRWNTFDCSAIAASEKKQNMNYARRISFGFDCLVHESHYFDVYGEIKVGNGTWIAGRDSQFWTHGASVVNRNISIGDNCYIGSACRFAPGTSLGNNVVVGLGSVISKPIHASNIVVAGVPAKLIRERNAEGDNLKFERWDS